MEFGVNLQAQARISTMINLKELKKLAQQVNDGHWVVSGRNVQDEFIAAANPTQVILLIESLELAVKALEFYGDSLTYIENEDEEKAIDYYGRERKAETALNQIKDKLGLE
jgi:hypothetical protein